MKTAKKKILCVLVAAALSACGGGGSSTPNVNATPTQATAQPVLNAQVGTNVQMQDTIDHLNDFSSVARNTAITLGMGSSSWEKLAVDDKRESARGGGVGVLLSNEILMLNDPVIPNNVVRNKKSLTYGKTGLVEKVPYPEKNPRMNSDISQYHGRKMFQNIFEVAPDVVFQTIPHENISAGLSLANDAKNGGAKIDIINQSWAYDDANQKEGSKAAYDQFFNQYKTAYLQRIEITENLNDKGVFFAQGTGNLSNSFSSFNGVLPLYSEKLRNNGFVTVGAYINGKRVHNACGDLAKDWCMISHAPLHGGTSSATAVLSGAAARVKARYDWATPVDLKNILFTTATDMGAKGVDAEWGHGLLNADKALNGYGRFDKANTMLNVQGNKKAYFFDNNISGSGGMIKQGNDVLVMNGDNTYTGATTIANGGMVLNGDTQSPHVVNKGTWLVLGDKKAAFSMPSLKVDNGAAFESVTAGLNLSGSLNAQGATINTGIGSPIKSKGHVDLRDAKLSVVNIRKGFPIEVGKKYEIVSAQDGIYTNGNTKFETNNYISNLVSGSLKVENGKTITLTTSRKTVGEASYKTANYTGRDVVVNVADGILDNVDLKKINSQPYAKNNKAENPAETSATSITPSNSQAVYDKLVGSHDLNKDLYEMDLSHGVRATEHAAHGQAQRANRLMRQNANKNGQAWVSLGYGERDKKGLQGIKASSQDNSQFIGAGKQYGKYGVFAQVGRSAYTWQEQFSGVGKEVKNDGLGLDIGGTYRFSQNWQAKTSLSYDRLKTKNNDTFNVGTLALGLDYRMNMANWLVNPYLQIAHTRTDNADFNNAMDDMTATARALRHQSTQAQIGSQAAYAFGNKGQFRVMGDVWLRQVLSGNNRYTFDLGDFQSDVRMKTERNRPEWGMAGGVNWQATDRLDVSLNADLRKGKYDTHKGVYMGATMKF